MLFLLLVCIFSGSQEFVWGSPLLQENELKPELTSLLGKKLYATPARGKELEGLEKNLQAALRKLELSPEDAKSLILYGSRLADLWRYHDAIDVYTKAIEKFPDNAMLYWHRGHRYISTRDFKKAVGDLTRASQLNNNDFDIWYHLGLAHYLLGDFLQATNAYQECAKSAKDDDSKLAVSYWLYLSLRRLDEKEKAAKLLKSVTDRMRIRVEQAYQNLMRFYKGKRSEKDIMALAASSDLDMATLGYGMGCWLLINKQTEKAIQVFQKIVELSHWPAFGYIAAEAELARLIQE
jgi:tetratricopeptide (TPR) repeat protein